MKVVLQRVKSASVTVDGELVSSIGRGILALCAVGKDDTVRESESSAAKVLKMKMWEDEKGGKWKSNVQEIGGEVLCVSQFTLLASTKKGNKPDFHRSAGPDKGKELYSAFFRKMQDLYQPDRVKDGVFQAMMDVALVNDGPVGVDYTSEDGVVTLEITVDPPPLPEASASSNTAKPASKMTFAELVAEMERARPGFTFPKELLE